MPKNTRGPRHLWRKMLAEVVKRVLLYASHVWADGMRYKTYARSICIVYRLTALRVCCAYRTVSDEAALVVAGMIFMDLLAKERMYVFRKISTEVEARDKSLNECQKRWVPSSNAR